MIASGLIPAISKAKISKKQGQHPSCSSSPLWWSVGDIYLVLLTREATESLFILCGNPVLPVLVFISCRARFFLPIIGLFDIESLGSKIWNSGERNGAMAVSFSLRTQHCAVSAPSFWCTRNFTWVWVWKT